MRLGLREPSTADLVAYICAMQPELDEQAASRIINLDDAIREGIAEDLRQHRDRAEALLELHLSLEADLAA